MRKPDAYQFHCFLVKTNKFMIAQPRFFVLSMVFMYNTKCQFNKQTGQIEFQEMQWMVPIQALTQVKMTEVPGKKIEIKLITDLN